MTFDSPYGTVTLTEERKKHILTFHPDVARCMSYFAGTVTTPDVIINSKHDPTVVIFYRFITRQKKYLAIVVKTGADPFILTAYLAKKLKSDTL
ncbi:MAG: PBECR2 nuclease fold domain-containing protein [Minisyncoccota bacterium]